MTEAHTHRYPGSSTVNCQCGSPDWSDERVVRPPARPLSPEEREIVERFEAAPDPYAEDYPASWDRIYPRCPACRAEQYALAVLDFSAGKHGCWKCHHVIREGARLVACRGGA